MIAFEAIGHYSLLVDEMERLGHRPKLCNPPEGKLHEANQEDRTVGCEGLAILLRNGTLPEVWAATLPVELRTVDQRAAHDGREELRVRPQCKCRTARIGTVSKVLNFNGLFATRRSNL